MLLLEIPFPKIDPVAFNIGIPVRWYGLAYMAGLLLGWLYLKRLVADERLWGGRKAPLTAVHIDDLLLWMTLGVVVGGRLGQVLFYEPIYFFSDPSRIFRVWEGGMSFHGGLLGSILAMLIFSVRYNVSLLSALDLAAAATPFGLFLGRIANFINGELWGSATSVPWGMMFPAPEAGRIVRHPSQLYEAFFEGLVLFLVLRYLTHTRLALMRPGLIGGAFMLGYGLARIFCEFFREPDGTLCDPLGITNPTSICHSISLGQLYSLPMLIVGIIAIMLARPRTSQPAGLKA
jgi:phosphatidylglycerol:prolipoprotein diacylglycerol transferase